ncbi:hypothetical protein [Bradyrhizobium shewense]|uniref:hypothetical protein n=1 Tax=Bradyrhizobium shewense TaxID=1761772 RepID=UPI00101AE4AA|nr:hypothetical protein [Bradyrhizobium shewense]
MIDLKLIRTEVHLVSCDEAGPLLALPKALSQFLTFFGRKPLQSKGRHKISLKMNLQSHIAS